MKIVLDGIGKRYRANWLFRNLSTNLISPKAYSITGYNGSGKSTLLLMLAGYITPNNGNISWFTLEDKVIEKDKLFSHFSLCSPALELFDELTLSEIAERHFAFRKMLENYKISDFKEICGLDAHWNKQIGTFSSGMKQRVKISLSILTESKALLMDEPSMNLDARSIEWYGQLMQSYLHNRLVIIATNNVAADCPFKTEEINIVQRS